MKLGKHQKSKQRCQDFYCGRSTTVHNLLFCAHTLCMNYVTNTFLIYWLVPQCLVNNYCVLCTVKAKKEREKKKHATKTFDKFHNHARLFRNFVS